MNTDVISATTSSKVHPCKCGCAHENECCELECLVQPRFFCGQLLTDQDLSVLLDWVKAKSGLARYRHGWGVVCGFEIQCCDAGLTGAQISIGPGYAVDCCGSDVVLCQPAVFDPSGYCNASTGDPCADWPPKKQPAPEGTVSFGRFTLPIADVQAVDLYVRHKEDLSDPHLGLARANCGTPDACQYSRVHEGGELYVKCVDLCGDPVRDASDSWYSMYRDGLEQLLKTLELFQRMETHQIEQLIAWLKKNPLHEFCFLEEWLCELSTVRERPHNWFNEAAFWIIQDWRNHYLRCQCYGCGPDSGVPLARVWMWHKKLPAGKMTWKVICVNSHPPFRRVIHPQCWPVPPGSINIAPLIWQPVEEANAELVRLGFREISVEPFAPEGWAEQFTAQKDLLLLPATDAKQPLCLYYQADNCRQNRLVRCEFKRVVSRGQKN